MSKFEATKEVNMDNVVMLGDAIICMITGKAEISVIKDININTKKVNCCERDCLQNAVFHVQVTILEVTDDICIWKGDTKEDIITVKGDKLFLKTDEDAPGIFYFDK